MGMRLTTDDSMKVQVTDGISTQELPSDPYFEALIMTLRQLVDKVVLKKKTKKQRETNEKETKEKMTIKKKMMMTEEEEKQIIRRKIRCRRT